MSVMIRFILCTVLCLDSVATAAIAQAIDNQSPGSRECGKGYAGSFSPDRARSGHHQPFDRRTEIHRMAGINTALAK
jgi:hypothetical protein